MIRKNDNIENLFEKFDNQWDVHQLDENHYDRFLAKQTHRKNKNRNRWYFSVAASVLLIIGGYIFLTSKNQQLLNEAPLEFASKQTRETDSIFTAMIKIELEKVKEKNSPINQRIVIDALQQMKALDRDYEKIKLELIKNGESKQIIHAMIRNLKTRISFLENVLEHIENNEKITNTTHESTT